MRRLKAVFKDDTQKLQEEPVEEFTEQQLKQIQEWHHEISTYIKAASEAANPALQWGLLFSKFLQRYCSQLSLFTGKNADNHSFAFCIGGIHLSEFSTPFCLINIFVILQNENDIALFNTILSDLYKILFHIAKKSNIPLFDCKSPGFKTHFLCGTHQQLYQQLANTEDYHWILQALSAIVFFGNNNILNGFQNELMQRGIFRNNKQYQYISSFLYDIAIFSLNNTTNKNIINLYDEIIAPTLLVLYALRYEFKITNIYLPKELVIYLEHKKCISSEVAVLFNRVLSDAGIIRWNLHSEEKKYIDLIKFNNKNKEILAELLSITAIIKSAAAQRIKKRDTTIYPSSKIFRSMTIDKQNVQFAITNPHKKSRAINIFDATDEMKRYFDAHTAHFKIDLEARPEAIASRLFNNVKTPDHFKNYIENFFLCINQGFINKEKFHSWMWAAIRRCSHDIFDTKGEIKADLLSIINADKWYDKACKKIGTEQLKKFILFSYFMNALFAGVINDPRYAKAQQITVDSDNPLMRQIQILTNEFFQVHIYPHIAIKNIQNVNYYVALEGSLACLNALIIKITHSLTANINKAESNLYKTYLGSEDNINTLKGLFHSISTLINHRKQNRAIKQQEFHDYDTKINTLLINFEYNLNQLNLVIKKSWLNKLFIESSDIEKILASIHKTKKQLMFFAQEAVQEPESNAPSNCTIS